MAPNPFSIPSYLDELTANLGAIDQDVVERVAQALADAQAAGRTVFCCGNGGSAAVASHFAADLSKLTAEPGRPRLRVMSLVDSVEAITAAANDFDYSEVFTEQLRTFMSPGDVVVGITTSGRSPNVVRALAYAATEGATTVAITGAGGTHLRDAVREAFVVPSTSVQRVEDVAGVITHLLCLLTRDKLAAGSPLAAPSETAA